MRDDDERWRGDGSAAREALTRHTENEASPRVPALSAEEVERRNAELAQRLARASIESWRAAALGAPGGRTAEQYYRAQWRVFRDLRGAERIRAALMAAAALDGVTLEDE